MDDPGFNIEKTYFKGKKSDRDPKSKKLTRYNTIVKNIQPFEKMMLEKRQAKEDAKHIRAGYQYYLDPYDPETKQKERRKNLPFTRGGAYILAKEAKGRIEKEHKSATAEELKLALEEQQKQDEQFIKYLSKRKRKKQP